ncbi:type II toxin-antitoxin system RelE/ParE family toxin [Sorangium cellulosum]|uniref:type II toxin-antitoxin system RelE/ParE family toxin n=1 Tax=Sorangium cellulosum TaxID=56 RepID=UPI00101085ED|nr:type II toxin-antitoxin system RelE/ParE family toxin [Sorangium cellulosum]
MRRLEIRQEAEIEVFDAALRYERERRDLGFRFESELDATIRRIIENPLQFPEIEPGIRRALVRIFPYGVFFMLEEPLVLVIAVLHLHRHPDAWKDRL